MARREAWVGTLPVPPNLAFSDWYFSLMIARKYEFHYVNRVLADYRVHNANHHVKVVQNRSEEPSIMLLLDRIFSEPEIDPALEQAKQAARGRVYATQYSGLATKYFGCGMMADARRCYLKTIRHSPRHALSGTLLRRLLATGIDQPTYTSLKRLILRSGL